MGRLRREPYWVEAAQVVAIHDRMVARAGLVGFPNPSYLESAVAAPKQFFYYGGGCDLFDLAAVYLYHIAKAHAFTDANKRTAYATAIVFLAGNDVWLAEPPNIIALAADTVAAAEGQLDKPALATHMRQLYRMGRMSYANSFAPLSVRRRGRNRFDGGPRY